MMSAERLQQTTAWLDRTASPDTRQRFYRLLFVLGFFFAGYVVWSDQRQRADELATKAMPALSATEARDWAVKLAPFHPSKTIIQYDPQGSEDDPLVASLSEVMIAANWPPPDLYPTLVKVVVGAEIHTTRPQKDAANILADLLSKKLGIKVPVFYDWPNGSFLVCLGKVPR